MRVEAQDERAIPATTRQEFQALTAHGGVFRLDRAHIRLTGADRVRWLNGMVTNNIRDLSINNGVYAFVLSPQGKIQADLYAFNRGGDVLIETESAQVEAILQIFDRYIIMDEVEVENLAGKFAVLGLAGPRSAEVLERAGLGSALQLSPLQISDIEVNGKKVSVVRRDNPSVPSYEFWVGGDDSPKVMDSLLQSGAQEIHSETLEIFRVVCGVPKFGVDIRMKDLPQETGQERALNFNKGCYIGQEIVERIRSRGAVHRVLTGFEVEGAIPPPGFRVQHEGNDVAELTSVAVVPTREGEQTVALGYGRKELMTPGKEYVTGETKLRVVRLPFTELLNG